MPANLKLSSETILVWNEEHSEDFSDLNDKEYIVAEALLIKKELKLSEVQQLLDVSYVYPVIKKLIEKNVCHVWEELQEKYKEKTETYIILHPQYRDEDKLSELFNTTSRAPKQMELLLSYLHLIREDGEVTQASLLKKSNASATQLKVCWIKIYCLRKSVPSTAYEACRKIFILTLFYQLHSKQL